MYMCTQPLRKCGSAQRLGIVYNEWSYAVLARYVMVCCNAYSTISCTAAGGILGRICGCREQWASGHDSSPSAGSVTTLL